MKAPTWRERALHRLDVLSAEINRRDAPGDPRARIYRARLAELRLDVERVAARSGRD